MKNHIRALLNHILFLSVSALLVLTVLSPMSAHALPYDPIRPVTLFIGDFGEPRGLSPKSASWSEIEKSYPLSANSADFKVVRSYFDNSGNAAVLLSTDNLTGTLQDLDSQLLETKFDLLSVPRLSDLNDADFAAGLKQIALRVEADHAFFIFDLPVSKRPETETARLTTFKNQNLIRAASFGPSLRLADGSLIVTSGAMAGLLSRVDASIGPWKAASGVAFRLAESEQLEFAPSSAQCTKWANDLPISVNCLRFHLGRVISYGARLTRKNDPDNRYISIRRTSDYFERMLLKKLEWARTAPMEEKTWKAIRETLEWDYFSFWHSKALVGALQNEAFFIRCGLGQTMTAADVQAGRLIVEVGLAFMKPAEFQILRIVIQVTQ